MSEAYLPDFDKCTNCIDFLQYCTKQIDSSKVEAGARQKLYSMSLNYFILIYSEKNYFVEGPSLKVEIVCT